VRDQEWLESALHALDLVYFDGALAEGEVHAHWHTFRAPKTPNITYGDYWDKRIRMSRVLADHTVPSYVTVGILFHETLHHVIGLEHDLTFAFAEAQYVHHAKAALWERANVDRLIYMGRRK
jgi:hypothetical protein